MRHSGLERGNDAAAHGDTVDAAQETDEEGCCGERLHLRMACHRDDTRIVSGQMPGPSQEGRRLLAETPRGTFALMLLVAALLFAGWALFYFGHFLPTGPVR